MCSFGTQCSAVGIQVLLSLERRKQKQEIRETKELQRKKKVVIIWKLAPAACKHDAQVRHSLISQTDTCFFPIAIVLIWFWQLP